MLMNNPGRLATNSPTLIFRIQNKHRKYLLRTTNPQGLTKVIRDNVVTELLIIGLLVILYRRYMLIS